MVKLENGSRCMMKIKSVILASFLASLLLSSNLNADSSGSNSYQSSIHAHDAGNSVVIVDKIKVSPPRIIAIGDLHGDLEVTRKVLQLAGAIDDQDKWIGKNLVIVQVGDVIDRGPNDRAILDLLENLSQQAKEAGGRLYSLLGNHEIMNVDKNFRYVHPFAWLDFDEFYQESQHDPLFDSLPRKMWGRLSAFRPQGPYAQKLSKHNVAMIIGETLFVHGGVSLEYAKYGLERINQEAREWMQGKIPQPSFIRDRDGPLWNRRFSRNTSEQDCFELAQTLQHLNCKRMVVGHTVQSGGITNACKQQVWRIDVGLSDYYGGPLEILEITSEKIKVLKP